MAIPYRGAVSYPEYRAALELVSYRVARWRWLLGLTIVAAGLLGIVVRDLIKYPKPPLGTLALVPFAALFLIEGFGPGVGPIGATRGPPSRAKAPRMRRGSA